MIRYPRLIIEVLSPSTEAVDRGKKFISYQECATLQEYIMVDSQSIRIEVYQREADGWKFHTYGPDSTVELKNSNIQFLVDDVYRGMKLSSTRNVRNRKNQHTT